MQDPATLPAMLCAFARFSGHCMLKSRSFSICSETHVITTSSGLISQWVCLTLSDTRARVWANCSNHKNPTRRAGNTHALTCADRGPILVHSGQGAVTLWPKHTHTHRRSHIHTCSESQRRSTGNSIWEKQEQKVKKCQEVWLRGPEDRCPNRKNRGLSTWVDRQERWTTG